MRRGDVILVDLEPVVGTEANKRRPAVVVSNDGANRAAEQRGRGVVTVVPVTSNTSRVYPFQVLLTAAASRLRTDSKAQAEQIRSVDIQRCGATISHLPPEVIDRIDRAIRLHLALN